MPKSLVETQREVDNITDKLGQPVDTEIKPLVVALRFVDFPTTGSCAGHLDSGLPFPWVDIGVTNKSSNRPICARMKRLLRDFYKTRPGGNRLMMAKVGIFGDFRLQFSKDITTNEGAKTKAELEALRREADDFAQYLLTLAREA